MRRLRRKAFPWTPVAFSDRTEHAMPSRRNRVNQLSLGVMARSLKENERRLALHPDHLGRIPDDLRDSVYLERGYGAASAWPTTG
jgi:hypothetical protein